MRLTLNEGELVFITGTQGPKIKLEPISSEFTLQPTDLTHPVKLGAHSIYLSLGVERVCLAFLAGTHACALFLYMYRGVSVLLPAHMVPTALLWET